ncbi:MAG: hypothetical protein Q8R53_04310 [Nanoarchaeota archaeon]|nr:hypothetical protein [Nanoarchaeota archaeon]
MKAVIKKEILYNLQRAEDILRVREPKDFEELKKLSDHAIEDVALHKDVDLITMTVLIYSFYKIIQAITPKEAQMIVRELQFSQQALQQDNYGRYNKSIRTLYEQVKKCHARVKEHLQDVMHAARIKKGTTLLQRGLSIGQAAGLMGLSNWDLQSYAAHTTAFEPHTEAILAKIRMGMALKLFGVGKV